MITFNVQNVSPLPDAFSTHLAAAMLHVEHALRDLRNGKPAFLEYRIKSARDEINDALDRLPESDRKKVIEVLALLNMPVPSAPEKRMVTRGD